MLTLEANDSHPVSLLTNLSIFGVKCQRLLHDGGLVSLLKNGERGGVVYCQKVIVWGGESLLFFTL